MNAPRQYDLLHGLKYLSLSATVFILLIGFSLMLGVVIFVPDLEGKLETPIMVTGTLVAAVTLLAATFAFFAYGHLRRACKDFEEEEVVDNYDPHDDSLANSTIAFTYGFSKLKR